MAISLKRKSCASRSLSTLLPTPAALVVGNLRTDPPPCTHKLPQTWGPAPRNSAPAPAVQPRPRWPSRPGGMLRRSVARTRNMGVPTLGLGDALLLVRAGCQPLQVGALLQVLEVPVGFATCRLAQRGRVDMLRRSVTRARNMGVPTIALAFSHTFSRDRCLRLRAGAKLGLVRCELRLQVVVVARRGDASDGPTTPFWGRDPPGRL